METQLTKKTSTSLQRSPRIILQAEGTKTLSVYQGNLFSEKTWIDCAGKIKKSFPDIDSSWFEIVIEQLEREEFTDQRLIDATSELIRNHVYASPPRPASLLRFDRNVTIKTHNDMLKELNEDREVFKKHILIKVPGKVSALYVHKNDFEKYSFLKEWEVK